MARRGVSGVSKRARAEFTDVGRGQRGRAYKTGVKFQCGLHEGSHRAGNSGPAVKGCSTSPNSFRSSGFITD